MRLSRDHTWVRLAALPEHIVEKFVGDYQAVRKRDGTHVDAKDIRETEAMMEAAVPGKGSLITEWALDTLNAGHGWFPNSLESLKDQAVWYFTHYKEPMFREAVQTYNEEFDFDINPKNLLDFIEGSVAYVMEEYEVLEQATRVNTLPEELPEGADMFYDDGTYQIVEASEVDAACELGQGTRWCTKDPAAAQTYLSDPPLYIIYRDQQKVAQFYLGAPGASAITVEIKNLKNRSFNPDMGILHVLAESGLLDPVLKRLEKTQAADSLFLRYLGREQDPLIRALCARYPKLALFYATHVIRGRFQEGEAAIAREPAPALAYAENILQGRFHAAEQRFVESGYEREYARMLWDVNQEACIEYAKENPLLFGGEFGTE